MKNKNIIFSLLGLFLVFSVGSTVFADIKFCGRWCPGNNYADMEHMTNCRSAEVWRCNDKPQETTTTIEGRITTTVTPYDWSYTCPCNYLGCAATNSDGDCTYCNSGGGPCGPVGRYVENKGNTTSNSCKYISSVNVSSWNSCVNGKQSPSDSSAITWASRAGTSCTDAVPVGRDCGVCGAADGQTYGITPTADLCLFGNSTAVTFTNGMWRWDCNPSDSAGGPVGDCRAKGYMDIGLRMSDGGVVKNIAVWAYPANPSPLKIAKGGLVYSVVLVNASNPIATKLKIETADGTKFLGEYLP